MAKAGSGNPNAGSHQLRMEDQRPLALLRRLLFETEESIRRSRIVIQSTRDAIELLERLEGRQFSN
jgi:hypothetical protein